MVDHIMTLIKQNNTTVSAVEKKLGWGNGSISKFDKSSPSIKKVKELANELGVSVSELIKEDDDQIYLSDDEKELLYTYRQLDSESKQMIQERAITLKEKQDIILKRQEIMRMTRSLYNGEITFKMIQENVLIDIFKRSLEQYYAEEYRKGQPLDNKSTEQE